MRIVTSGSAYLDIDAYAGAIAYAELLQAQGISAQAVSTAPLNESISETVRSWKAPLTTNYTPAPNDTFTLIDVSDPEYFDTFVDIEKVDAVIDHHPGFEKLWQDKIGSAADIEFIGAACTLVYEHWKKAGLLEEMSETSAKLLVCGILDNTLNFGAKVTTQRDIDAYNALVKISHLNDDWTSHYFMECQNSILEDATAALKKDTKTLTFHTFEHTTCFGQLVVWDAKQALEEHSETFKNTLSAISPKWFMNLISVGERKSYFVTDNPDVQQWLTQLLHITFTDTVAAADRLWLRKEVIKQDMIESERS